MTGHHDFERGYDRGYADGLAAARKLRPALLKALKELVANAQTGWHPQSAIEQARAAIAKAEGK